MRRTTSGWSSGFSGKTGSYHAKIDGSMEDLTTYYTLWVHQIKTPIAAMDLLLQAKEEDTSALEVELQRISQ